MVVLLAMVALVLNLGFMVVERRRLQNAADAIALAATYRVIDTRLNGGSVYGPALLVDVAPLAQQNQVSLDAPGRTIIISYINKAGVDLGSTTTTTATSGDHADVLLDVPASDAMLLGDLVRSGMPLTYTVRQGSDTLVEFPVITLDQTRSRLALAPRIVPSAIAQSGSSVSVRQQEASQVHFVTYAGVDLFSIEQRFGVTEAALIAANPALDISVPIAAGTELVVPDLVGFVYPVAAEDTLASLSQRYNVPAERLRLVMTCRPASLCGWARAF